MQTAGNGLAPAALEPAKLLLAGGVPAMRNGGDERLGRLGLLLALGGFSFRR